MLRLQDLTLMKTILFGIGFGSVLLAISALLGIFDLSHLSIKSMNFGVILGGILFGFGFGYVGTCPGTCVAALGGDGKKQALVAIMGGLVGALAYSLSYGFLKEMGVFSTFDLGKTTLFTISDAFPAIFNTGFMGIFIVGILLMGIAALLPTQLVKAK